MSSPASHPLVSVVIPAYGHEAYVMDTLDSVFAQSETSVEVIVVDDGSPDATAELVAPLHDAGRIRLVRQANAGVAAARNTGAALARGTYLLFLDDDDRLLPDALTRLVTALDAHPALAFVSGRALYFGPTPPTYVPEREPTAVERYDRRDFLPGNCLISPGQALIRRAAFERVGGFDRGIWGADDWDLWLRLLAVAPAGRLRGATLAYRMHAANSSRHAVRMRDAMLQVMDRHLRPLPASDHRALHAAAMRGMRTYLAAPAAREARGAITRRDWRQALRAGHAWLRLGVDDYCARARLKAHLVARGRWRLPAEPG